MQAVRRWRELDATARGVLVRVTARAVLYRLALLLLPWRVLAKRSPVVRPSTDRRVLADVQWAVDVARSRVPLLTCLALSFAARDELARAGVESAIDIGVIRDERGMRFHAVARAGEATIGDVQGMTVLASLPHGALLATADKG